MNLKRTELDDSARVISVEQIGYADDRVMWDEEAEDRLAGYRTMRRALGLVGVGVLLGVVYWLVR